MYTLPHWRGQGLAIECLEQRKIGSVPLNVNVAAYGSHAVQSDKAEKCVRKMCLLDRSYDWPGQAFSRMRANAWM